MPSQAIQVVPSDRLIPAPEIQRKYATTASAIHKARRDGRLHGSRIGKSYVYTPESVVAWLNGQNERQGGNIVFVLGESA